MIRLNRFRRLPRLLRSFGLLSPDALLRPVPRDDSQRQQNAVGDPEQMAPRRQKDDAPRPDHDAGPDDERPFARSARVADARPGPDDSAQKPDQTTRHFGERCRLVELVEMVAKPRCNPPDSLYKTVHGFVMPG